MNIIFIVNKKSKKIELGNEQFREFFKFQEQPFICIQDSLLSNLIDDGLEKAILYKTCGKLLFEYFNKTYLFNVEMLENNQVLFNGYEYQIDHAISLEMMKLLADNLPDMLWAKDVEGKYLYANKALASNLLSAKDISEPLGKNDVFFALREREKYPNNPHWHTFGEMCFNSDEVVLDNMKTMVFEESGNVKGKHMILEVHKAPFIDNNGMLLGTIGSGRDITEEIRMKRELRDKSELLIQQSKMAQLGEILESIAHQWRHPLSLISMVISTAMIQKSENMEVDLDNVFESVLSATQHLSATIDDFRDFFKQDKAKTHFLLNKTFQQSLALFRVKFKTNNVQVIPTCEVFELYGYRRELIQVFMNLLSNANDAIEEFEKDKDKRFIFINIYKEANFGIVKIKDTGRGMDENILEKIFEPRFTTKDKDGSGIGLYMTKEIIEKHMEGEIRAKNATFIHNGIQYRGAEFTISLPLE